jgi:hypothetical protein
MVSPHPEPDRASSHIIGTILGLVILFVLAVMVLPMFLGFQLPQGDPEVPTIFKIINIVHTNDAGKMTKASRVVLTNSGDLDYPNSYLFVKLFVKDIPADLELPSLNGNGAINLPHHGYKNVGGPGTGGKLYSPTAKWYSGQSIAINFKDGMFGPGDTIRIEVYDGLTGKIISRDTYPPEKKYTAKWFTNYFLNHQAA